MDGPAGPGLRPGPAGTGDHAARRRPRRLAAGPGRPVPAGRRPVHHHGLGRRPGGRHPADADDGLRAAVALRRARPDLPVLVLSQYIEQSYAAHLLDLGSDTGIGYLLKDRVSAVGEFTDAVARVAAGATVIDPEVVRQLLNRRRDPLRRLTPREREVLALMAEGRANAAIAQQLHVTEAAVNKHIGNIFQKLDLPLTGRHHRRVLAVLTYLRA
ncbi:response regulator transcription factor [Streptomyces sp. NRRL F-4489]|uniref:LuxR C-terminal-related transcriptional regulator n=1 Tax=Streptomyces sp. NRRL F-4489 TaxID=1609095 RepID=UPI00099ECBC5